MTQDDHDEPRNSSRTAPPDPDLIRMHAVEAGATDPTADGGEIAPFVDALADATVVGMGEATHRTREFARLKHRLFRALVERHGVRLFALEAPFSETMALHGYVWEGKGTAESALEGLGLSIHAVVEMAAFVRWLRSFNRGRPPSDRVAVYGFDVQSPAGAAAALRDSLEARDDRPNGVIESLETVARGVIEGTDVNADRLRTAERAVASLEAWLDPDPPGRPGPDPTLLDGHLRVLDRSCEFARAGIEADRPTQWGLRDRYMAETVEWIREYDDADRIAVWAHDNHVKRGRLSGDGYPSETMGEHLARMHGGGYYALGMQFGGGSVRALVPAEGETEAAVEFDGRRLVRRAVPVPEPVEGSIPVAFGRVDVPVVLLDYRGLPEGGWLRAWLDAERPHHYVAGSVDPDDPDSFYRTHNAVEAFDGLAFVREATPTTPLDSRSATDGQRR